MIERVELRNEGMNTNIMESNEPILLENYLALKLYNWFPTYKKDYCIQAKMVSDQTDIYNYLEDTHYNVNVDSDVVLKGTLGEEWVNTLTNVAATYTKLDGSEITLNDFSIRDKYIGIKSISKKACYAHFIPFKYKIEVHIEGGAILHANREGIVHGQGDYLVCSADKNGKPDLTNIWVVNGVQFEANYDLSRANDKGADAL